MSFPYLTDIGSVLVPFLYLTAGYLSLLLGFEWAGRMDTFVSLKGADKIMLTFIIGVFWLLVLISGFGTPSTLTASNFAFFLPVLGGVVIVNSAVIGIILAYKNS